MKKHLLRSLLAAAFLHAAIPSPAAAQQRPTAEQARVLLQSRPELVEQLRQRIVTSGMTPEQVRARLRAEGYPADLLDKYLPDAQLAAGDTLSEEVFGAVRALGLADSDDVESLRLLARPRYSDDGMARPAAPADSAARAAADSGYPVFGLDVFRRETSQFDPNVAGPVDASYRLGPGDQLVLILTGDVEAAYTLDVTREGIVVVPQAGQMTVANLTLAQLEDLLHARLSRIYSGISRTGGGSTRFTVTVSKLRSNQVFVVGDVAAPGSYRISSAGTALSALYAAGGPTENGSLRAIEVRRGGRVVERLDVYDYLLRGDASHDPRLQSGDVIFVPVHGARVRVWGEVVRPATYELRPGEDLAGVIAAAGGLTERAARQRIQIERIVPARQRAAQGGRDRIVIDVSSTQLAGGDVPPLAMEAGDIVRVFPVNERVRDRVVVSGHVWAPGTQAFRPGMTLTQALRAAGGVRPDAYLGQVLVTRTRADETREQLRATLRDTTGAAVQELVLAENDEVQVFALESFRPPRHVVISGAVRKDGRYPWREGMTMRDLVLLAGGLDESAHLQYAEVARLPESRANGATARTVRVPLDSSYLFERRGDGAYFGPPGLPAPNGPAPDMVLAPYDNVLILRQPDWELQRTVVLSGEVQFPGRYTLVNKSERLSDVIRRAGGLTPEAYPEGVVFIRGRLGRIGVDLRRVLAERNYRDDLILLTGDEIRVPAYNPVVTVTGAVHSPVAVPYSEGASLDQYIAAAGGPTRQADSRLAYVTQPNGKVETRSRRRMLPDGTPSPRAGSVVHVPAKDPNEKRTDYIAGAGNIAQVLASLVAIVVVLRR